MKTYSRLISSCLIIIGYLLLTGCTNNESEANTKPWLPDTAVVKLPMEEYLGIPFNIAREEARDKFGCTAYELSLSCKIKNGDVEEQIWLIYNEAGRMVLMKKELGYFNKTVADTIIERFTIKYGLDFTPTEGQESAFAAGIRKSKTYIFGGGQIAFQIGRSMNNRNELMLVYFFPEDVGTTFAKSVQE